MQTRQLARLGPYQSLALLMLPLAIIEPLKFVALLIAGEGHWMTGTITMIIAYLGSLLIVERLFRALKPKLMELPWFSRLWVWFATLRDRTWKSVCLVFVPVRGAPRYHRFDVAAQPDPGMRGEHEQSRSLER